MTVQTEFPFTLPRGYVDAVQRAGGLGSEMRFALNGLDNDQVRFFIDGVPLNLGWDARADLSVLPATAATSLTLVRGLPSVLHGPNVLGGVLEVGVGHHPGRWMPPESAELSAGIESTGAYSAAAAYALLPSVTK